MNQAIGNGDDEQVRCLGNNERDIAWPEPSAQGWK